jgi:hypothetical protein
MQAGTALRVIGERRNVHPRDVVAFLHGSQEHAQMYVDANQERWGHPSWGPVLTESGWLEVVDLRPALALHDIEPTDPALPDAWRR